jgi:hypothetical protein
MNRPKRLSIQKINDLGFPKHRKIANTSQVAIKKVLLGLMT